MNPDPEPHQMLAGKRKKISRWGKWTFLILLCYSGLEVVATGVPGSFPLTVESRNACIEYLTTADTTQYPAINHESPYQSFVHGNTLLLICIDPLSSQYLRISERDSLFSRATTCFLLAADTWRQQGKEDSLLMAISGGLMTAMEVISLTRSKVSMLGNDSSWSSLLESLEPFSSDPRLFSMNKKEYAHLHKVIKKATYGLDGTEFINLMLYTGFSSLKSMRWDKKSWGLRKTLVSLANLLINKGRYDDAQIVIKAGWDIFSSIPVDVILVDFTLSKRSLQHVTGDPDLHIEVTEEYFSIINLYPHTRIWRLFGEVDLIQPLFSAGRYEESRLLLQQTEGELSMISPKPWEIMLLATCHQILSERWESLGNLKKAGFHIGKTIALNESVTAFPQSWSRYFHLLTTSASKDQLSILEFRNGKIENAYRIFQEAQEELIAVEQEIENGSVSGAEKFVIKQLIGKDIETLYSFPKAMSSVNLGMLAGLNGEEEIGEMLIKRGLDSGNLGDDSDLVAKSWGNLAAIQIARGAPDDSIEYALLKAREAVAKNRLDGLTPFLDKTTGDWWMKRENPDSAFTYYLQAANASDSIVRLAAILAIGSHYLSQNHLSDAKRWLVDSLQSPTENFSLITSLEIFQSQGAYFLKSGQLEEARISFLAGWNRFNESTDRNVGTLSSSAHLELVWPLLEGICSYHLQLGQVDSAFFWQEQVRSDFLNYLTVRQQLRDSDADPLIQRLEEELTFLNRQILEEGESSDSRIQKVEVLTRLEAARISTYPDYQSPVPLDSLQLLLNPEELLLEYAIIEDSVWLFLLNRDTLNVLPIGPYSSIEPALDQWQVYLQAVRKPTPGMNMMAEESLNLLHNLLIDPIEDSVLGQASRLIIVPDGRLYDVPFAALSADQGIGEREAITWLTSSHEICLLPAANWLTKRASLPSPSFQEILLLAHSGKGHEIDLSASEVTPVRSIDGELQFAAEEVKAITAVYEGAEIMIQAEEDLTETWFMNEAKQGNLSEYDLIHFAGHVTIDPVFPSLSALLVEPDESNFSDGRISTFDFSEIDLNAEMVVLSGCHSSGGRQLNGAGRLGFMQALTATGVNKLVLSQWNVDDYQTSRLFTEFYTHLSNGLNPAQALQQAQLSLADDEASFQPYLWAAFQLFGVPE